VGTIARLDEMKGIDVLLRAVVSLAGARLIVAGRGPDESVLHRLATKLGIDDRVEWVGWTEQPAEQLPRFTVFVLPSRSEGLPLSVCEAMLAGLPVVASDVGGVGEVVVDGETGVLVPPDHPDALAGAIETLLRDAALRARMGEAGRQRARTHFTASAMARSYESLYAELVTRRATSTTSSRTMSVE
jgi:glycosyltransferase involved in cell wall biosynthesis